MKRLLIAAAAVFLAAIAESAAAQAPKFLPAAVCPDPALDGKARCGFIEVPENRNRPRGRRIQLQVVILPSLKPERGLAPLYDIDGGPGMPVTKNAGFYLTDGAAYRDRTIVMMDQRGTGGSYALHCRNLDAANARWEELYPPAGVARCRDHYRLLADLTRYGTAEAVADLEDLRRALGHEKIDLFGLSYGTIVAQRYMAAFPERVRSAVLWGAVPPDARPPMLHAQNAEAALRLLFADCMADPVCAKAFPDLEADLDRALARLPASGALSRPVFLEKLRSLMYLPTGYRRVPWVIAAAARGDLEPFRKVTASPERAPAADGMYLSVTCSESLRGMDYERAAAEARRTRFGDYRLRRQRDACALWPARGPGQGFFQPLRTAIPVLILVGGRDPATPPDFARRVAAGLPRSKVVVVEHGGHLFDGLNGIECVDRLILGFYDAGSAEGLDTGCLAGMTPPPFYVPK